VGHLIASHGQDVSYRKMSLIKLPPKVPHPSPHSATIALI